LSPVRIDAEKGFERAASRGEEVLSRRRNRPARRPETLDSRAGLVR
jgi:hypothetical protein